MSSISRLHVRDQLDAAHDALSRALALAEDSDLVITGAGVDLAEVLSGLCEARIEPDRPHPIQPTVLTCAWCGHESASEVESVQRDEDDGTGPHRVDQCADLDACEARIIRLDSLASTGQAHGILDDPTKTLHVWACNDAGVTDTWGTLDDDPNVQPLAL